VKGAPLKTEQAKQKDIAKFLQFFEMEVGHDHIDNWTPAVSKQFQRLLTNTVSPQTNKMYKTTTVNRVMATIRHVPYPIFSVSRSENAAALCFL
jgi:integrase/recombinase XerD